MTDELKLIYTVLDYIPCKNDKVEELTKFFNEDYKINILNGDGIVAYTEEEDYYWIWFAYTGGLLSSTKMLYNTVRDLSKEKPVLYTGIKDNCQNNSLEVADSVYQLKIGV